MERQTRTKYSEEERGYLGISCINVTSDLSENFSMPQGIFVAQVYSGTGAETAGLVRGNIVVAFDGVTVQNQEELTKQMQYYKAGESVEITIMVNSANGYQQKNVTVTLSSYDQINAASKAAQESNRDKERNRDGWARAAVIPVLRIARVNSSHFCTGDSCLEKVYLSQERSCIILLIAESGR